MTNLFCGPLVTFCSVLVKNAFHAEAETFGGTMAAFGLGGLIGAASSFFPLPKSFKRDRFATAVGIFLGLVTVAVALNHSLLLLFALLVLAGAALTATNISANTFLQENATNTIRGRIASLYQLALHGGLSAGGLITGFVVSQLTISTALFINGTVSVILLVFLLWRQFKSSVV